MTRIFYTVVFLFSLCGGQAHAQSLWISSNGQTTHAALITLQKLSFSEGVMTVSYLNSPSENYALSAVDKMWFETAVSSIGETPDLPGSKAVLFPNPAENEVRINGADAGEYLITQIDGKRVRRGDYVPGSSLDVSDLQPGLYLLRINGETLKLMKR